MVLICQQRNKMKNVLFIIILLIVSGCSLTPVKYITDPTGEYFLSYFPYFDEKSNRYIVFSYGKLEKKELPASYIKVRDKAFDGWKCLIEWKKDTVIIYERYHQFTGINLEAEKRLQHKKMIDSVFYKIYFDSLNTSFIKLKSD
jgi:hypothetical protein